MYFYRLRRTYDDESDEVLLHDKLFTREEWERMVLEAVNAFPDYFDEGPIDSPYPVAKYLIKHYGFARPQYAIEDSLERYFDDDEPLRVSDEQPISFGTVVCLGCGEKQRTFYSETPITFLCPCGHVSENITVNKEE